MKSLIIILSLSMSSFLYAQPSDASAMAKAKTSILNAGEYVSISSIKVSKRVREWNSIQQRWEYNIYMYLEGKKKLEASGLIVKCGERCGVSYNDAVGGYGYLNYFLSGAVALEPIPAPDQNKYREIIQKAITERVAKSPNDYPVIALELTNSNEAIKYGNKNLYAGKWYQWTSLDQAGRIVYNFEFTSICKKEKPRSEWDEYRPTYNYYKTKFKGKEAFYIFWDKEKKHYYYKPESMFVFECADEKPSDNGELHYTEFNQEKISKDEYNILKASTIGRSEEEIAAAKKAFAKPQVHSKYKTTFESADDMANYIYKTIIESDDYSGIESLLKLLLGDYYKSSGYELNDQGKELLSIVENGINNGAFKKQYCKDMSVYMFQGKHHWHNLYTPTGYPAKYFHIKPQENGGTFYIKSMGIHLANSGQQKVNCDKSKVTSSSASNPASIKEEHKSDYQIGDLIWMETGDKKKHEGVVTKKFDGNKVGVEVYGKAYMAYPEHLSVRTGAASKSGSSTQTESKTSEPNKESKIGKGLKGLKGKVGG